MHSLPRTSLARQGFTLIELLTVIAIIGILAAIIIPTVGAVRQTAREAKNISNLRQLALALNIHANENRDRFVYAQDPVSGRHWKSIIGSFVASNGSNLDWTNKDSVFVSPTAAIPETGTSTQPCHYVLANLLATNGTAQIPGPIARGRISRASQVILVADGPQSEANGNVPLTFYFPNETSYGNSQPLSNFIPADPVNNVDTARGYLRYRNRDSVHVGMVDGSARSIKRGAVTYGNVVPYQ